MSHIVFVLGSYFPNFQAVGLCVKNVIDELKDKHEITIVCQKVKYNEKRSEYFEGTMIERIQTKSNASIQYFKEKLETSATIFSKIYKVLIILFKIRVFLKFIISKEIINHYVSTAYKKRLVELNKEKKIDLLIPCVSPIESCIGSINFKLDYFSVELLPYMFDNFATNFALYKNSNLIYHLKFKNNLKIEKHVINNSKKILCMKHYANSFKKNHIDHAKLEILEHPLLIKPNNENKFNFNPDDINIVYTGGLFKKIRNPRYALSVISKIIVNNPKIKLHFFGSGNCYSIIKEFSVMYPNKIINHGYVDSKIAEAARNSCDFLLSIGNISNNQTPSKIIEYLSISKPIIHFAKIKNDYTIDILSKYPNSCVMIEEKNFFKTNILTLNKFMNQPIQKISFKKLEQLFYDAVPSYTARIIEKFIQ